MGGFLHTEQHLDIKNQLEIWMDVLQRLHNAEAKDDKL
jgi:hypothetical protein